MGFGCVKLLFSKALMYSKTLVFTFWLLFFLSEVYHSLSRLTLSQMQVLIESDLSDISHVLLVKESFADSGPFIDALLSLKDTAEGKQVLQELGMSDGFEPMTQEDGEFMIDLMDTLLD